MFEMEASANLDEEDAILTMILPDDRPPQVVEVLYIWARNDRGLIDLTIECVHATDKSGEQKPTERNDFLTMYWILS